MKVPHYYRTEFESFFADIYDIFFDLVTFFQIKKIRKKAVKLLCLKKGMSVVDFACGTGGLTVIIAEHVGETGKVIGVDLSQRMQNNAKKKLKSLLQVSFVRHNFEDFFIDERIDAVTIGFGAHEVPTTARQNMYKNAYKLLKMNGKLLVFDYAKIDTPILSQFYWLVLRLIEYPNGLLYVKEDHQKILKEIGFSCIIHKKVAGFFDIAVYQKVK